MYLETWILTDRIWKTTHMISWVFRSSIKTTNFVSEYNQ